MEDRTHFDDISRRDLHAGEKNGTTGIACILKRKILPSFLLEWALLFIFAVLTRRGVDPFDRLGHAVAHHP